MNPQSWDSWLRRWLKRNPIPPMPDRMRSTYAQEVLERVRAKPRLEPRTLWDGLPQPRLVFSLGTALAAALAILVVLPVTPGWKSRQNGSTISSEKEAAVSDVVEELETLEAIEKTEGVTTEDLWQELRDLDQSEMG